LNHLPKLLIAAAMVISVPLPAAAQAWPATVVAAAPQMTAQKRQPLIIDRTTISPRPWAAQPTHQRLTAKPALKLSPKYDLGQIPEVTVQAKDEWSDDQGLRVGPTKLAFKRRF